MAKAVRYSIEQKQKMRERALALQKKGATQAATAKDLGIAVKTLVALLKGKPSATSPKKSSQKATMVGKKPRARRGVRYTVGQKQEMRKRALELRKLGRSQKAVAEDLGIAVQTLRHLMRSKPAAKAARADKGLKRSSPAGRPASDPLARLAALRKRVEEVTQHVSRLNEKKAQLQKGMKVVYEALGKHLLGGRGKR